MTVEPAVWFPTVRTGTGTDVFTARLCDQLNARGLRAGITWLPHRAEYLPWTVQVPQAPSWANVVHVNTWIHPRFIAHDLPVVATLHHSVHDPALRRYKGHLRTAYHRFWISNVERRVMERVSAVVAVSRFAADMARMTLADVPIEVVHNGIDTARFNPRAARPRPHPSFRLLYVGSWNSLKGVDLLAPIMRDLGDGYTLHYTGGPAAERDKPVMPANMIDLGRLSGEQVVKAMREADVFLFPSRSEGLPQVVLEAMACGLPVVATAGSSMAELVEHDVTGVLCRQDDVRAFADAIRSLTQFPDDWEQKSYAASVRAKRFFGSERMVDGYCGVYANLLTDRRIS